MVELLIIAMIVLWSAYIVFKKVFPTSYRNVMQKLAKFCVAKGWQRLAKWLSPPMVMGCGGGCGCKASDGNDAPPQPVKWR